MSGRAVMRVLVALAFLCAAMPASAQGPRVAAAADLSVALEEVAGQFTRDTGESVTLVFGASGTLTRQIRDGAPFELFLSADEAFVADLASRGLTRDEGVLYAIGRLALFAPNGSPLHPDEGLDGLARLLASGGVTRFAIANPAHAPYGRAAEAALRARGIWDAIQPRLLLGENVAQTAQFAATGDAVGGLIAHAIALAPAVRARGTFALIPADLHPPLRQRMVLLKKAGPTATSFYAYLQSPAARRILERYGFALPD